MGVITSSSHEATLRSWLEQYTNSKWIVEDDNPDLEKELLDFERQAASCVIIDESGFPFFDDISSKDLPKYARAYVDSPMEIIFIASPKRKKDDEYLHRLIALGITRILCLRYFAHDPEGARGDLDYLLNNPVDANMALGRLNSYIEMSASNSGIFDRIRGRKDKEIDDVLIQEDIDFDDSVNREASMTQEEWLAQHNGKHFDNPKETSRLQIDDEFDSYEHIQHLDEPTKSEVEAYVPEPVVQSLEEVFNKQKAGEVMEEPYTNTAKEQIANEIKVAPITEQELNDLADKVANIIEERKAVKDHAEKLKLIDTYAIAGAVHGVGVTHFTISLALHLSSNNPSKKVVCLLSNKEEFNALQVYPKITRKENSVFLQNVEIRFVGTDGWPTDADYVVCDCNVYSTNDVHTARLFATSKHKFIVVGGTIYKNAKPTIELIHSMSKTELEAITWCRFGTGAEFIELINAIAERKGAPIYTHLIPYDEKYLTPRASAPKVKAMLDRILNPDKQKDNSLKDDSVVEGTSNDNA